MDPGYYMILESTLDDLVQEVWRQKFMDIGSREVFRKWLHSHDGGRVLP